MDSMVFAALIGAVATVLAAVLGRSKLFGRWLKPTSVPDLRGDWESSWNEHDDSGQSVSRVETITITKMRGNRVEGLVKSPHFEGKPCRVEGFFSGRFLLLIWYPAKKTEKQLIEDYGCYFLEKTPDGRFEGTCRGFFYHLGLVATFEIVARRTEAA